MKVDVNQAVPVKVKEPKANQSQQEALAETLAAAQWQQERAWRINRGACGGLYF